MIEINSILFGILGFFAFIGLMTVIFAAWFITSEWEDEKHKSESEMFLRKK